MDIWHKAKKLKKSLAEVRNGGTCSTHALVTSFRLERLRIWKSCYSGVTIVSTISGIVVVHVMAALTS